MSLMTKFMGAAAAVALSAGADSCMTGGGSPCQDVSQLHTGRAGMGCSRSLLFRELGRVVTAVEREVDMGFVPHHTRPILRRPAKAV